MESIARAARSMGLQIHKVFSMEGLAAGQRAWRVAAGRRVLHNDLATVDFLYSEFVEKGLVNLSPRHHIFRSLIQWHFEKSKHSARAAHLLFPEPQSSPNASAKSLSSHSGSYHPINPEERQKSSVAIRFLQGLWETKADPEWLLLYFRRVIGAARLRGVELFEEFFAIMIRFLASSGYMTTAQALHDEMVYYHGIEASFLSRTLLLRGYARKGDWRRVEREIESLHNHGLSRIRPHGYALMLNAVLQEYATRSSAEQFQDFLLKAICYWGLIPTSSISTTTIHHYLAHRRYDLVKEWVETLQVMYPQIETETFSFQWSLVNSWQRTGADCEDIEETIRALAYRNPQTKLRGRYAIPVIHEALARNLAAKLDAAKAKTDSTGTLSSTTNNENKDFDSTKTIDEYLSSAFSLTASTISRNRKPAREVIELHRQATAVQRVQSFLNGLPSSEAVDEFSFPMPEAETVGADTHMRRSSAPTTLSLRHLKDSIPKALTGDFLPDTATITTLIINFYDTRSLRELSTDHTLLLWVCERLSSTDRVFDAIRIIQKVYKHKLPRPMIGLSNDENKNGSGGGGAVAGFSIDVFEFWMRLAWAARSLVQWKYIVEEVLHLSKPRHLLPGSRTLGFQKLHQQGVMKITSSFMALTRFAVSKTMKNEWLGERRYDESRKLADEVVWLYRQLEDRREKQTGRRVERTKFRFKGDVF